MSKVYDLFITVTRHGPKKSFSGPLTEEGKRSIEGYFIYSYKDNPVDDQTERRVISSPVNRSVETAQIYEDVMEKYHQLSSVQVEQDPRLSENNVEVFKNSLPAEQREDWFGQWYRATKRPAPEVHIGREAIRSFASWLIEQINSQKEKGGNLRIDAFSHGPVMAAFILRLEEKLNKQILNPLKQGQNRLEFNKLFANEESEFGYLGTIGLRASSDHSDYVNLIVRGKNIEVPLNVLAEISRE